MHTVEKVNCIFLYRLRYFSTSLITRPDEICFYDQQLLVAAWFSELRALRSTKESLGFSDYAAYIVHHTGSWYTALGMTVAKTFERLLTCHRWRKLALPLGGQRPGTTNIALATRNKLLIRKVNMFLLINYGESTYSQAT